MSDSLTLENCDPKSASAAATAAQSLDGGMSGTAEALACLKIDALLKERDVVGRKPSSQNLTSIILSHFGRTTGVASIEWFHRRVESGGPAVRRRILYYNEDDCRATRVLHDGIAALAVIPEAG